MNPFLYPKSRHVRRQDPGPLPRYQAYKPALQREFSGKCVYCRMPDSVKDYESYGVDHYRPKSRFRHLLKAYSNLFYCCNPCNRRKGEYWPPREKETTHFVPNPCDHEMFRHLRFKGVSVDARSDAGIVAVQLMDLNDPGVLSYRQFIMDTIKTFEEKKGELERALAQIRARQADGTVPTGDADAAIASIEGHLTRVGAHLSRLAGE